MLRLLSKGEEKLVPAYGEKTEKLFLYHPYTSIRSVYTGKEHFYFEK